MHCHCQHVLFDANMMLTQPYNALHSTWIQYTGYDMQEV